MLFDFNAFISELRENPEKKEMIEKYENALGEITWNIKDQIRFREYLINFKPMSYAIPDELENDFDWDLLQQLVVGSFSSDYELKKEDNKDQPELYIAVKSGDQSIVKKVSELRSFQIQRLYEIYIEEQLNLEILRQEKDEEWSYSERTPIDSERVMRQRRRQAILDTAWIAEEQARNKEAQAKSLDELMWQL